MSNKHLIVDFETTGLRRDRAWPMEVACIACDPYLRPLGEFTRILSDVRNAPPEVFEKRAVEMHTDNTGLIPEIMGGAGVSNQQATADWIEFLHANGFNVEANVPEVIVIGNQPEFDVAFAQRFFEPVARLFHYRNINVSSIREIVAMACNLTGDRLKSAISDKTPGARKHRAIDDCRFALTELHRYAAHINGQGLLAQLQAEGRL